jgi:subtilisin family serine protease
MDPMRWTMLRRSAPLISSIALAVGLLGGVAEPAKAQGLNNFGGMGGGFFRRDNDRGGGGGGVLKRRDDDRGSGNSGGGPKIFQRDGGGPKESFGGPKGMPRDSGRGMSTGDAFGKGRPKGLDERAAKGKLPDGLGSRLGRESSDRGRLGRIEGNGGLDRNARIPKRETQNSDNPKLPATRLPFPKRETTTNGGNPKYPWPGRNPKDSDRASTDGATDGGRGPKFPGKYPWPNRNPKGTDQASTNPGGSGTGNPPCRGPRCAPPQTGDGGSTVPPGNPPCRGPRCLPPQTGDGGSTVPPGVPPCRGPRCPPPQTGDGGSTVPPGIPPCRGPRCLPPQTGDGGSTVPPGNPPCRGSRCAPPQTGDNGPNGDGCRGRKCGDGYPPRRPPIIVIGPIDPIIPPPDYDDGEPDYDRPTYTPPANPTPVYEPATPVRPRPPAREVNRTPPPPAPPFAALPPSDAPLPMRRDFVATEQPLYRPNEVLVTVQGAQPDAVAGQLAQSFNLVIEESQAFALLEDRRVYRFRIPDNRAVEDVVATVANAPGVTQSLPNFYHTLQGGPGELGGLQYALPKLRVPDTYDLVSGRGVTVAVIDSGVDAEHPALKRANIQVYDAVDGGVKDPDKHGTAIAGIIAGKGDVNGIAPGAKLLAIRAFAPQRLGAPAVTTSMTLARATDVAFARGARVVNMSFAGPRDDLLISLIDAAHAKGVVFIAAAGNQGPSAPPAYPAAYEKVIGITATDEDDGLYAMANRGKYISVAAPGVDILVPVVGKALDYMSGTSFAAAHISGIAALLIERNPKLAPEEIRDILFDAAHDLGATGRDDDFGAGLADAYEAVGMATAGEKVQSSSINQ